tara:strand:- start:6564 stop:7715 length:1152 start_codon:yes stop_codon:yes gene_type:complete
MKSRHTISDVLNRHQDNLDQLVPNSWKSRTLHAIRKCRTQELGGHVDQCTCCKSLHLSYNSCRNRHCPTCQGHKREAWINARTAELLNVPYFHVVFTIPHELNSFCLQNPRLLYATLFKASWATLKGFSKNPMYLDAKIGAISLLHTWGQNLQLHPHLHCIVPGGGVTKTGAWKNCKSNGNFLFDVKEMSIVFRAKFVAELRKNKAAIPQKMYDQLFKKEWVVYAKKAFCTPSSVIEYLGRYSHKVAISNHRILNNNKKEDTVTFRLKNYKKNGKKEILTLKQSEFIRRFSLHILPKGFTRIRHYGILSGTWKSKNLKALQEKLNITKPTQLKPQETKLGKCRICKKGLMETIFAFSKARPPPKSLLKRIKKHNELIIKIIRK